MTAYGGVFQPYQHKLVASSTDEPDLEEGGVDNDNCHHDDRPEDEDGTFSTAGHLLKTKNGKAYKR